MPSGIACVLRRLATAAVGDHGDLQVVRDADDVFRIVSPKYPFAQSTLRAGYEDLAHLGAAGEFDYGLRNILAAKDLRLDPKVAGKAQMLFHGRTFGGREVSKCRRPVHKQREAVGVEKIGCATPPTYQHRARSVRGDVNQNSFLNVVFRCLLGGGFGDFRILRLVCLIESGLPEIDFMGSLTEGQFPQGALVGAFEKSRQCLFHHFRLIDRATFEAVK